MNKRCIVNVATGEFYCELQERLLESLWTNRKMAFRTKSGFGIYQDDLIKGDFDVLLWTDELPPGSRHHSESPYGFKVHAIKAAYEKGYTSILWLDSPAYAVKEDISPIFEKIEKEGYYVMSHIDPLERFIGSFALENYQVPSRELDGHNLPSGSCYGFDMSGRGFPIMVDMIEAERKGMFRSQVNGQIVHRHDEAMLALTLIRHRMPVFTFDPLFQSDSPECVIKSGEDVRRSG